MKIFKQNLKDRFIASYVITNGVIYFFENYCVLEMDEGVKVDFDNCCDAVYYIKKHFPNGKLYGIISHRINSYAIDLPDIHKFKLTNIEPVAFLVVTYNQKNKIFLDLESRFCRSNRFHCSSLIEAETKILDLIKGKKKAI